MKVTKKMLEDRVKQLEGNHGRIKGVIKGQLELCQQEARKAERSMYMNQGGINLLEFMAEQLEVPAEEEDQNEEVPNLEDILPPGVEVVKPKK